MSMVGLTEGDTVVLGLQVRDVLCKRKTDSGVQYMVVWKASWVPEHALKKLEGLNRDVDHECDA